MDSCLTWGTALKDDKMENKKKRKKKTKKGGRESAVPLTKRNN